MNILGSLYDWKQTQQLIRYLERRNCSLGIFHSFTCQNNTKICCCFACFCRYFMLEKIYGCAIILRCEHFTHKYFPINGERRMSVCDWAGLWKAVIGRELWKAVFDWAELWTEIMYYIIQQITFLIYEILHGFFKEILLREQRQILVEIISSPSHPPPCYGKCSLHSSLV